MRNEFVRAVRHCVWLAMLFAAMSLGRAADELKIEGPLSDGAVLQQNAPIPVWGRAPAGAVVRVKFDGQEKSATADGEERWKVVLEPRAASTKPLEMEIASTGKGVALNRTIHNILIGEVWLCSGQSNMAMRLLHADGGPEEIAAANDDLLRSYHVPERPAEKPWETVNGEWVSFAGKGARDYSAVAYYFAKRLRAELGVPVGLLLAAWPGSGAAAWVSAEGLDAPELRLAIPSQIYGWAPHHQPSNCYNGMIAPLVPYPIAGVIWYQGETDAMLPAQNPFLYRKLLPALIEDWRRRWGIEIPFYWVQLPNSRGGKDWPILRESQTETLRLPRTGQIPSIDIGSSTLLHPKNKADFGGRLAGLVLARQYGKGQWDYPAFAGLKKEGGKLIVSFNGAGGLKTTDGQPPLGFEIAGEDGAYHPAEAVIAGNTVVLTAAQVPNPISVRYAWQADPKVNLVNSLGLPAAPFRTDKLPVRGEDVVWSDLPVKADLATTATGADLVNGKAADWALSSDEEETMKMVRAQPSGGANIIFKDDPARAKLVKFASPTLIWSTKSGSPAEQMAGAKGATALVVLDLVRATRFERGFDFELGVKQGDGTVRRYTLTIFPMQVRALQGNEVRMLGTNLDNTGYHEYRIAVRPDGIAQAYLDNTPLGLLAGEVVPDEEGIKESYLRIGKTVSRGDFIAHLAAAGFDSEGAFAPSAEGPSVKMQAGEEEREEL